jgi:hypothetical protein
MHFTLTDLITDITQNGAESGAGLLELQFSEKIDTSGKVELSFTVIDDGKGMTKEELERAQDPFVTDGVKHPNRKVGLGLPFLIQTAETSGGGWKMDSRKQASAGQGLHGTTVSAWFDLSNVDTPPVGDIPAMFRTVLLFGGPKEVVIKRQSASVDYELRKSELIDVLGGLEDTQSLILLNQYLRSLEESEE